MTRNDPIYKHIPKCGFDCESFGHICCHLGDGKGECRRKENCPDSGMSFLFKSLDENLQHYLAAL